MLLSGVAAAETIWSIGHVDGSFGEFAIAGAYADYSKAFPQDVTFMVGASTARKSWPYIQPGPDDAWAESKTHPYSVKWRMRKTPKSACRIMVYLCDMQPSAPVLAVTVNGHECPAVQLPGGAGDPSLTNPGAGRRHAQPFVFPGAWLKRGENIVSLTTTAGSWLLYDAVALESGLPNTPQVSRLAASCTPMFKSMDGALKQAVRVEIENAGLEGAATLQLADAPETVQAIDLKQGAQSVFLLAPPFAAVEMRRVLLAVGDKTQEAVFESRPEMQYKLFVAASTHTDIGYTDLQEKCMELHVNNAMQSLDAAKSDPGFKYNLEVFAQADWIKELRPDMVPAMEQAIRGRTLGLTALYLNMLTGMCSGEEMMWLLRPAQRYGRSLGVPVEMASLNDVPTSVGTLPMFFRAAGVKYFAEAINEDRGPVFKHADPEMIQSPFWWEAPDGSRLLTTFTRTYFQVSQIRMQASLADMEATLPKFLKTFTREDYPCDAVFINGGFVDNTIMTPRYAEVAAEWNRTWDFPKVILATPDEYFRYVEENFGNALPVYRGDMGVFWEDGAASSAAETAMVRWAKANLSAAEKWGAIASAKGHCESNLDTYAAAWKEILYYDEHTWGSAVSISDPNNPQTSGQWARKAAYATRSLEQGRAWAESGEKALCALAKARMRQDGHTLLVANPFSWERDITVVLPAGRAGAVRDKATGRYVPSQKTREGGLCFVAGRVPAMGYRLFDVTNKSGDNEGLLARDGDDHTWRTARYRIHIDPRTGGLDRITDLATGREWVDSTAGFGLNQYLYVTGGNGTAMIHPPAQRCTDLQVNTHDAAAVTLAENGPARAVLHIERTGGAVSPVDTDVVFHADGTLDVVNVIHKRETLEKEAGYFVFPFGLNAPDETKAYIELPYGIIEADTEQMPGACREWYCANTFAAVGNNTGSAYVATPDTPLFCVGDINRGLWPNRLNGNRHVLYAYVFNNYWHTNYKASQGGDIRCGFSVRLSGAPFDPVAATQFGWERALDMTPERSGVVRVDGRGSAKQSFVSIDQGPVILSELLPVDGGVLARLYNPSDRFAETAIRIDGVKVQSVHMTDLIGDNGKPVARGEKIPVRARGIATVMLSTR